MRKSVQVLKLPCLKDICDREQAFPNAGVGIGLGLSAQDLGHFLAQEGDDFWHLVHRKACLEIPPGPFFRHRGSLYQGGVHGH